MIMGEIHRLAEAALAAVRAGDWEAAAAPMNALADTPTALGYAALYWCDSLVSVLPPQPFRGLGFINPDGTRGGAEAARTPQILWAGRLIVARANDDEAIYRAVYGTVPPHQYGLYLGTLLESVAVTLNDLNAE